jgi:hypothetical protein
MAAVTQVLPHPKSDGWRRVITDEEEFICFSAKAADALTIGQPLPQGTEYEEPKFEGAKRAIKLPRDKNAPQAAFRNTKDGQLYEQERMDRRTALMQAVQRHGQDDADDSLVLLGAEVYYTWLRQTAGVGVTAPPAPGSQSAVAGGAGETTSVREGAAADEQASGAVAHGEGARAPGACNHKDTSPLKLDGKPTPKGYVRCLKCNAGVKIA